MTVTKISSRFVDRDTIKFFTRDEENGIEIVHIATLDVNWPPQKNFRVKSFASECEEEVPMLRDYCTSTVRLVSSWFVQLPSIMKEAKGGSSITIEEFFSRLNLPAPLEYRNETTCVISEVVTTSEGAVALVSFVTRCAPVPVYGKGTVYGNSMRAFPMLGDYVSFKGKTFTVKSIERDGHRLVCNNGDDDEDDVLDVLDCSLIGRAIEVPEAPVKPAEYASTWSADWSKTPQVGDKVTEDGNDELFQVSSVIGHILVCKSNRFMDENTYRLEPAKCRLITRLDCVPVPKKKEPAMKKVFLVVSQKRGVGSTSATDDETIGFFDNQGEALAYRKCFISTDRNQFSPLVYSRFLGPDDQLYELSNRQLPKGMTGFGPVENEGSIRAAALAKLTDKEKEVLGLVGKK